MQENHFNAVLFPFPVDGFQIRQYGFVIMVTIHKYDMIPVVSGQIFPGDGLMEFELRGLKQLLRIFRQRRIDCIQKNMAPYRIIQQGACIVTVFCADFNDFGNVLQSVHQPFRKRKEIDHGTDILRSLSERRQLK